MIKNLRFTAFIILILMISPFLYAASDYEAPEKVSRQGTAIYQSGNYEYSVKEILKMLNQYPDDQTLLLYLAYSYDRLGQTHKAERTYISLLELNKENVFAKRGLSSLYQNRIYYFFGRGDDNAALDFIKKGQYYLPDMHQFYLFDAQVNGRFKNWVLAADLFKTAWERIPQETDVKIHNDFWIFQSIGDAYKRAGRDALLSWIKEVSVLQKKYSQSRELMTHLADLYMFAGMELNKRNQLKLAAYKLYTKENGNPSAVEVYFPLKGRWLVTSGNFESLVDTHNGYDGYCFDLIRLDESGNRLSGGNGGCNEDYLSYNSQIYAAFDGVVETVADGAGDNTMGKPNFFAANYVRIRHVIDNQVCYSVYHHVRKGTVTVSSGQTVKAGDPIAKVGNSGLSYAPHLHFGVYNSSRVSIPVHFLIGNKTDEGINYRKVGTPKRGDILVNE